MIKAIGATRKIDRLGRVVIPIELRRAFKMDNSSEIEMYAQDDGIYFRRYDSTKGINGIVRKIDDLGRIVLPIEMRRYLDIDVNDALELFTTDEGMYAKKYNPGCIICGGMDHVAPRDIGKHETMLCAKCIREIQKIGREQ